MIKAIFPNGLNEIKLPAISQWDYNRKLSIAGINTANNVLQVHFSNEFSRVAIVRVAYKNGSEWQVNIPNVLLQERYNIYAYVYLNENESGRTEKKIIIPVLHRKRPDDYPQNSYEEAEINKLIDYTNKLGGQVSNYSNLLAEYKGKKWVKPVTKAEYNAMVDAGTLENDVLYCFTDVSLSDSIAAALEEGVKESIKQSIENGEISIGQTEEAANVTSKINGKNITDIFESDGTTAKKATTADSINQTSLYNDYTNKLSSGTLQNIELEDGYRYALEFCAKAEGVELRSRTCAIAYTNTEINEIVLEGSCAYWVYGAGFRQLAFRINTKISTKVTTLDQIHLAYFDNDLELSVDVRTKVSDIYLARIIKLDKVF